MDGIHADFTRTCEGCAHVVREGEIRGVPGYRCFAPGHCQGYTVSSRGHFLPYVPAWCPLIEEKVD